MALLVGLPLKLFLILFALIRLTWPLLCLLLLFILLKHFFHPRHTQKATNNRSFFDGPVIDVDYRTVDEKNET